MTVCSKGRIKLPFFFFLLGFLSLASCRKNEDTVGSDLVGSIVGFNVVSTDTATVLAYTSKSDSVITKRLSYYMLGAMNDPEFGTTRTSIATEVDIPSPSFPIFANSTIDSIVLQITYASSGAVYGNASTTQTINVYELDELLSNDSLNFSDKNYAIKPSVIGSWTGNYTHLGDSVSFLFDSISYSLAPHIRIKLDNPAFVQKIKNASASDFLSSTSFKALMHGFYIKPETNPLIPGDGAIAYMNMASSVTAMVVYYNGTQKAEFPISNLNNLQAKGNSFKHEYSVTIPIQPSMGGIPKDVNYVQPAAGLKTRILFPHLFDFVKTKNIAITGADLSIGVDQSRDTSLYKLPTSLILASCDSLGQNEILYDLLSLSGFSYIDGTYYSQPGEYRFSIMRQVQNWLNEYKNNNRNVNYGLNLLVPTDGPVAANRAILDTRSGKIKLKLSYTVIQ